MKKLFLMLASCLLFLTVPVYAQHGTVTGGSHAAVASPHATVSSHSTASPHAAANTHGTATHAVHSNVVARSHWDGKHFDRVWFGAHYGRAHRFYWGHCWWHGPPCGLGSWFWWGGNNWVIWDPIPGYWCGELVYIDQIGDEYVLVNPSYPGVYFRIGVQF